MNLSLLYISQYMFRIQEESEKWWPMQAGMFLWCIYSRGGFSLNRSHLSLAILFVFLFIPYARLQAELPSNHDSFLRQAFLYQMIGQHEKAIESFEAFFASGSDSGHSRLEYAMTLLQSGRSDEALQQINRSLEFDHDTARNYIRIAEILRQVGQPERAFQVLEGVRSRFPENGSIDFSMAEILMNRGEAMQARQLYTRALFYFEPGQQSHSYKSISLWRLAEIYLREDDIENATVYLLRYHRLNPERLFPRFLLGFHIYFRSGQWDKAEDHLSYVASFSEDEIEAERIQLDVLYKALAEIYYLKGSTLAMPYLRHFRDSDNNQMKALYLEQRGEDRQALSLLLSHMQSDNESLVTRVAITRILERMGRDDLTGNEFLRISILAVNTGHYRLGMEYATKAMEYADEEISRSLIYNVKAGAMQGMGQLKRTAMYLRMNIEVADRESVWSSRDDRYNLQLRLAGVYSDRSVGKAEAAMNICNEIILEDPDNVRALFTRSVILIQQNEPAAAIEDLNKAISFQQEPIYYFYRAMAYYELFDHAAAVENLENVLSIQSDHTESLNFLGFLFAQKNENLDRALEMTGKAVDSEPANGAFQDSLGLVYLRMGDLRRALYHLELATMLLEEAEDEDPVVYKHLGDVYHKLDRNTMALSSYRKALTLIDRQTATGRQQQERNDLKEEINVIMGEILGE